MQSPFVLLALVLPLFLRPQDPARSSEEPQLVEPPCALELALAPDRPVRLRWRSGPDFRTSVYVLSDLLDTCLEVYRPDGSSLVTSDDEGGGRTPFACLLEEDPGHEFVVEIGALGNVAGRATAIFVLHPEPPEVLEAEARSSRAREEAEAHGRAGREEEALAVLREAAEALLSIEGADRSVRMMYAAERLGVALKDARDFALAARCLERALHGRRAALPPTHPHIEVTEGNLCWYLSLADPEAGVARARKILAEADARYPPGHARRLQSRHVLASTLQRLGRYAEAIAPWEEIIAARPRDKATDHARLALDYRFLLDVTNKAQDIQAVLDASMRAVAVLAPLLPEDDPQFLAILAGRAAALGRSGGRRQDVLDGFDRVVAGLRRRLPETDLGLLVARANRAGWLKSYGRIAEATPELEDVHRRMSVELALPDDHRSLLWVRTALSDCYAAQGRLEESLELVDRALRGYRLRPGQYPETAPDLLGARETRADRLASLGRLAEARAEIEGALDVLESAPPEQLGGSRRRILRSAAQIGTMLGDLVRARALYERRLAAGPFRKGVDVDYVHDCGNYASVLLQLGEGEAALLQMQAVERYAEENGGLPETHETRFILAATHASILLSAARYDEALAVLEGVDAAAGGLHRDHLAYLRGAILGAAGSASAAVEVLEDALDRSDPAGSLVSYVRAQMARLLLQHLHVLGEEERARAVALRRAEGITASVLDAERGESERVLGRLAGSLARDLSAVLTLAQESAEDLALGRAAFAASETLGASSLVPALLRRAAGDDPEVAALGEEVRRLGFRIADAAAATERAEPGEQAALAGALDELVRERDLRRAAISGRLSALEGVDPVIAPASVERAAGVLRSGEAAVGYQRYERWDTEASDSRAALRSHARYLAAVVRPDASLRWVDLGPADELDETIGAWRRALGVAAERGIGLVPGAAAGDTPAAGIGARLHALAIAPVLAAAGDVECLVVAPDAALGLVPFDALAPAGGAPLGDGVRVVLVDSLRHLDLPGDLFGVPTESRLLVLGGVDYDADAGPSPGPFTAPPAAALPRSAALAGPLASLPGTAREAQAIARLFGESFDSAGATILTGSEADRKRLFDGAPRARFLHLATHGWFAEELAQELEADRPAGPGLGLGRRVVGYAPLTLCGLALAGANHPASADGVRPGRITAEELAGLDLGGCELAVLSACETAVGLERRGEGLASLRRALTIAGARWSLTSLWKVPDEATQELMIAFYEGMWTDGLAPREALWHAKRRLREARAADGRPLYTERDWAGWVLYGPLRD